MIQVDNFRFLLFFFCFCSCVEQELEIKNTNVLNSSSNELIIYNWEEYTPQNVIDQFEKETGIKVTLKTFQTFDEKIAQLQSKPDMCDLLITDTEEAKSIFEPLKIIEPLDQSLFKNTQAYHSVFNESSRVSVPYCFGLMGLAVDTRYVDVAFQNYQFLLNSDLKGKISLLDEPIDLYYLSANGAGFSVNDTHQKVFSKAKIFAKELKKLDPIFQDVYSGLDALIAGEVWVTMAYSGEALIYQKEHPHIKFIYPDERPMLWADVVCVNGNAPNRNNAYRFLEFINTPQVAAEIAVQFKYAPGIIRAGKYMDREALNNPLINIPKSLIENCEVALKTVENNSRMNEVYQILTSMEVER